MNWVLVLWWSAVLLSVAALVVTLLALFHDPARRIRRCPRCWYDMSSAAGLQCSECGATQRDERRLYRTRRNWRRFTVGAAMFVVAGASVLTPAVLSGDWTTYTPTPVLRFGLSFFPREAARISNRLNNGIPPANAYERLLLASFYSTQLRSGNSEDFGFAYILPILGKESKILIPDVLNLVRSENTATRLSAASALASLPSTLAPLSSLREVVAENHEQPAIAVLYALTMVYVNDPATIRTMQHAASAGATETTRFEAALALCVMDPDSDFTEEAVSRLANHENTRHRIVCARVLGWYAHSRETSVQPSKDRQSISWFLKLSRNLFPRPIPSDKAIQVLISMLADVDLEVRYWACNALAGTDAPSERTAPAFLAAFNREPYGREPFPRFRLQLLSSYLAVTDVDVTPFMDTLLEGLEGDLETKLWAAEALTTCGVRAVGALPQLVSIIIDTGAPAQLRKALCRSLAAMGTDGWRYLDTLIRDDADIGEDAAAALSQVIDRENRPMRYIVSATHSPDVETRRRAVRGLSSCGSAECRAVLEQAFKTDPSPAVRLDALASLARRFSDEGFADLCSSAVANAGAEARASVLAYLADRASSNSYARLALEQLTLHHDAGISEAARHELDQLDAMQFFDAHPGISALKKLRHSPRVPPANNPAKEPP